MTILFINIDIKVITINNLKEWKIRIIGYAEHMFEW